MCDLKTALTKSNLFLESYKNCDEKYKPWVEEVRKRRDRLFAQLNQDWISVMFRFYSWKDFAIPIVTNVMINNALIGS